MELQPASERVCWNKWDDGRSPTYVRLKEMWMQQIHRIRSETNRTHLRIARTSDCSLSTDFTDRWGLQIHRYLRRLEASSTDISHSWILQIHRYRRQLDVANPQISQTAGCCISTDSWKLHLTQLDIADTQISQTAWCCKSTNIANSWMLRIHRYLRELNIDNPQISQTSECYAFTSSRNRGILRGLEL